MLASRQGEHDSAAYLSCASTQTLRYGSNASDIACEKTGAFSLSELNVSMEARDYITVEQVVDSNWYMDLLHC